MDFKMDLRKRYNYINKTLYLLNIVKVIKKR